MHLQNNSFLQGGKYKIIRFINSGGFGCTYEAEHIMLEKRVAIKEFFVKDFCNRDEVTAQVTVGTLSKKGLVEKLLRKFIEEAKALCHFEHPGIVRVSDVFEENGTAYYVMKYIDGKSLNQIVFERGRLSETMALDYIHQVADALAYVHAHSRLHLDIKPSNIMIDGHGRAILIDFGASKQYDEEDGVNTSTLLGKTPGYAPLEQMGNDVVKFMPATDIYALGATFYKLLTGITPLNAGLLASGEELDPLPVSINENTRRAIKAAMVINKKKRPQTIQEFLSLLDGLDEYLEVNTVMPQVIHEIHPVDVAQPQSNSQKSMKEKLKCLINKRAITIMAVLFILLFLLLIFPKFTESSINDTKLLQQDSITNIVAPVRHLEGVSINNANHKVFTYTGAVNLQRLPHGKGKGIYADGVYEGMYENGIREGEGSFITADRTNHFVGTFVNDMYSEGRLTMEDGSYYEGSFKNNNFENGQWYSKKGDKEGIMKNGKLL